MSLNPAQLEAVRHTGGPLLVLAGAGSGKTRVIAHKMAFLVGELGVSPHTIAALTFTNKAAREMRERVATLVGPDASAKLMVSTFHTLGLKIIGHEHEALGCRRGVSIFDQQDGAGLLKELLKRDGAVDAGGAADAALATISAWKSRLVRPDAALASAEDPQAHAAARLYAQYERYLRACNAVDFDDLIALPVHLFRERADIRDAWQNRLRWLMVDEYQDTNAAQYELLKLLAGPRANLTVVGDDDQSIYAWRGAQPENLALLGADFPQLKVVKLEQNYRSSQRILHAANTLIAHNPHLIEKRLWSALGQGDAIEVVACEDGQREAERVVMELITHHAGRGHHWRDYAVLYRSNHQARAFERLLREHRVPYRVSGGTSFFDRAEVRDLIAYLRLLVNPDDDTAFLRVANVPRREVGTTTLERLGAYAMQRGVSLFEASFELGVEQVLGSRPLAAVRAFTRLLVETADAVERGEPVEVVRELVERIGYRGWLADTSRDLPTADRRMETVNELTSWMERLAEQPGPERSLADLLAHMSLMDMLDKDDEGGDAVALMTLHAAKGLEFPCVFLTGIEEGLLPHRNSVEGDSIEEERRLLYVGITRAQRRLWLTYAGRRKRHREDVECEPSRFLSELPADALNWARPEAPASEGERKEKGRASIAALRGLLNR
ncbi:MAG: UvrD-helicase domain-containing protein [Gammaproteobacteria bacterium]